jgi:hypothetical protein
MGAVGFLAWVALSVARAEEGDPAVPPAALEWAQKAPPLTDAQLEFLEPRHSRLRANARAQTDFTAYTLEWGEVKIGVASLSVGALPRLQLTTVPLLDVARVYNGSAKYDFLTVGRVDLAAQGALYRLPAHGFVAQLISGGLWSSVRVADPWSVHLGLGYDRATARGLPDLSRLVGILSPSSGEVLEAWTATAREQGIDLDAAGNAIRARLASDVRLNRRDSIVLQAQALVWSKVDAGIDAANVPSVFGLDSFLSAHQEGFHSPADYYVSSLAWQFAWKRVDLRVGAGLSSIPYAWLLQSTELSIRFGGATRREESRMRRAWEKNQRGSDAPTEQSHRE